MNFIGILAVLILCLVDASLIERGSSVQYYLEPWYDNPQCGKKQTVRLGIVDHGSALNQVCQAMLDYIDHPQSHREFDVIQTCEGGLYDDPWNSGNHNNTKFVFTNTTIQPIDPDKQGLQIIGGRLVIDHPIDGVLVDDYMHVGIWVRKIEKASWYYIYCP